MSDLVRDLRSETVRRILTSGATLALILTIISTTFPLYVSQARGALYPQASEIDYSNLIQSVNVTEVMQHATFLTNLGTRATGYEGNKLAKEYVFNEFDKYLEDVGYHNFTVVDAIDYGANITLSGISPITIYPLRPNLVCPSTTLPEGITGPLIYAKQGYLEDFDGMEVNGSIVLMDWYTRDRWTNAAKFGAKAVIFLPPTQVLCSEWELTPTGAQDAYSLKYLPNTPLNFPRFYVPKPGADTLLANLGEEVRVRSTQVWEEFTGQNVMGWIKGPNWDTDLDKIVVLSSYYDSYSVAPSIAPGAQEALGVASLLELARYLSDHPPKHTVFFIAFGAHHQALTGATMFLNDYLSPFRKEYGLPVIESATNFAEKFVVHLNLDLSTGSEATLLSANSRVWGGEYGIYDMDTWWCMGYPPGNKGYLWHLYKDVNQKKPDGKTYRVMFAPPSSQYGGAGGFDLTQYAPAMPWRDFAYDHEPHVPMRTGGYTLTTAFDPRPYYGTPFDTLTNLDAQALSNLQTQLEFIRISVASLLNEELDENGEFTNIDLKQMMEGFRDIRVEEPAKTGYGSSWIRIKGQVATWSTIKAWYEIWHNKPARALVYMEAGGPWRITQGAWHRRFTFTDVNGTFEFFGASTFYGHEWYVSPWVVNSTTGNVIYAPDQGRHTWGSYVIKPTLTSWKWNITWDVGFRVMFKASTLALFDMMLSTYLTLYEVEIDSWTPVLPLVFVYRSGLHLEPESWSQWPYGDTAVVLAVPPNQSVEVVWKFPVQRYPHGLLLNPTPELPMGVGYAIQPGEQLILPMTNLKYAETFRTLNEDRLNVVGRFVPDLKELQPYKQHVQAGELIENANNAIANHEYSKAYSDAAEAWRLCQESYLYARPWIEDASFTVVFLAALLIPFVFLAEKLLFNWSDLKRIASYLGIFASIVAAFYLLHPGFMLAASPTMIIIGFSTLILSAPLLLIVIRYVAAFINAIRLKRLGRHEAEVSRMGELSHAFMTGVENMRKMKLRTILTLVSIVVMVAALCNITSISAIRIPQARTQQKDIETLYEGIYLHKYQWGRGNYRIPDEALSILKTRYGDQATIAPRAWKYTNYRAARMGPGREYQLINWRGEYAGFRLYYNGKNVTSAILWGLTPQELDLGWPDLIAGDWFEEDVQRTVILTDVQAMALGIGQWTTADPPTWEFLVPFPAPVVFEGVNYTVIGIVGTETPLPLELDMEDMTPIMTYEEPTPMWEMHVPLYESVLPSWLSHILIINYEDVVALGGETASISMKFGNPNQVEEVAAEVFSLLSGYQVYSSSENEIKLYTKGFVVTAWGLQYQAIPMAVVFLAVFNIMLGTVHERKRDIAVYGTVGLSPLHIAFMFLAESAVYALLGGVIGYVFALLQGQVIGMFVPGIVLNYSSSWVVIAVAAAMGATLLSALYPIILASRLVTPSLERVWKVPTKPVKDMWEIPLPFYAPQARESGAILAFLREYVEPHLIKDAPDFSVSNIATAKGEREGQPYLELYMDSRLFPYEIGVTQKANIYMTKIEPTRWECRLVLRRTGGPPKEWVRYGRNFIDLLRKQLLLWRTMTAPEKERYARRFKKGGGS